MRTASFIPLLVGIVLPLDAWAQTMDFGEPEEENIGKEEQPEESPLEADRAPSPGRLDPESRARARRAATILENEPRLDQIRRAALSHFRLHPRAIERVRHVLRSKAALPNTTMSGWYNGVDATRETRIARGWIAQTDDQFGTQRGHGAVFLAWNLPNTVFTPAQLQTYSLTILQIAVIRTINTLYFRRRQILLRFLAEPPSDPRARSAAEIRRV